MLACFSQILDLLLVERSLKRPDYHKYDVHTLLIN